MTKEYCVLSSISLSQTVDWNIKHFFNSNVINSAFEMKRIGKALTRRKNQMTVEEEKIYKRITIKTNCGGVVVRDEVCGKDIKTKSQYYIKAGQLAVSKIDARNGAFGEVPPEADGAIITGNFWVYDVNPQIANIDYLILLLSSNIFVQAWQDCSNGSGNRLYLQEEKFLNYKIPMPQITVQNAIVSKYYEQMNRAESICFEADKLDDSIDDYLLDVLDITEQPLSTENKRGIIIETKFKNLIGWGAKINSNPIKPQELFKSNLFENFPIEYYCKINPKTIFPNDTKLVSFVPMECVSDIYGEIVQHKDGEISKSKGYTSFKEKDIIWAKITPCMQNGKCAVANNLKNGFGYGSTEFHIFRANENALPEYIYYFLRSKRLREIAITYFTGSAGQQRVGTDFLEALTIPKIPVRSTNTDEITQEKISKHISKIKQQIKALHCNAKSLRERAKEEFEEAIFGEAKKAIR